MKIITMISDKIKELDDKIKRIMNIGFKISFLLCIISVLVLLTYEFLYSYPSLFYAGISLLHTSLMFGCAFFMCGIGFDTIRQQIV